MILVTGATGKVGRHVVAGLLEAGVGVRALVRQPLLSGLPPEVEPAVGDINDPKAVRKAAAGVDAAFLLWPSFSAEGAAPVIEALTEQVRRVVYLSALSVKDGQADSVWGEVEQLLTGADWTFLRAGGFAANALSWAAEIRTGEVISMPSPKAGRSLIHERDLADIAVLALLDDAHIGRKYELTGPQVLTQEEQIATIASVIGKDLRIAEQSADEARQQMLALGADKILAESAVTYWESLVDNPEPVATDYAAVTGKPGRTFREWAEDHADAFRVLSTEVIANQYVESFRTGQFQRPQPGTPDVVRVAPLEYDGELVGLTEIMDNAANSLTGHEIASVEVSDPLLSADQFAVRFTFHWTADQPPTTKLSLYTVETGHITREEVFYFTPPA